MKKTLDWQAYIDKAVEATAEGQILVVNENHALPLAKEEKVAVFGHIQTHYLKSGTGSGGMVNVVKVIGITDALIERGATIDQKVYDRYKKFEEEQPYDPGAGWGLEPISQPELVLTEEECKTYAAENDTAIYIVGRICGEDYDNKAEKGAYYLSDDETTILKNLRKTFKKVVVVLNVSSIMDMNFVEEIGPDAVLYAWHGGMVGALGTADVLLGNICPSGSFTDTLAKSLDDYPSTKYFGEKDSQVYGEDIFVGYRYFETFAKDKVLYPFGYGLSYTSFARTLKAFEDGVDGVKVTMTVKNTGSMAGKDTVQLYVCPPDGKLGTPNRVLVAFEKTKLLAPGEEVDVVLVAEGKTYASFDDKGVTGHDHCFVLEEGEYQFFAGRNVRAAFPVGSTTLAQCVVLEQCSKACAPVEDYDRMVKVGDGIAYEKAPKMDYDEEARRVENLPKEIPHVDRKISFKEVSRGDVSLEEFIGSLCDADLRGICRGEGMGSPKVTAGTAAAFGGVTASLAALDVPCGCCDDGPSGMRLDSGATAFAIPGGNCLASTMNRQLQVELFTLLGREMTENRVDCLLGPGINIRRNPLNGRNFEYFSEDPYLTGEIAVAQLKGLHSEGVTGTIKHFCANNKEKNRHFINSVVSERALREIYLKGFEIAVKKGGAKTIMTTYGSLNGIWTSSNYDLNTVILRQDWKYDGLTMTDWWAHTHRRGQKPDMNDLAAMVKAQNDLYMTRQNAEDESKDNLIAMMESGDVTRAELQRIAKNVLGFLLTTHAMDRIMGTEPEIEIVGKPKEGDVDTKNAPVFNISKNPHVELTGVDTNKGASFAFTLEAEDMGDYEYTITASSEVGELAQMAVSFFSLGAIRGVHTFNGSGGKAVSLTGTFDIISRFSPSRLFFAESGLNLISMDFKYTGKERKFGM
ncbi:MAG: glycoside hydrolase family 3 C-terminal domain-containing protein [Lachnospiraceae bacterium]|nr:glycoside hydrolase family 3 C-terminal domain-containing protein [Lachnospiraceae bacterium]